jgi:hypothetical protein
MEQQRQNKPKKTKSGWWERGNPKDDKGTLDMFKTCDRCGELVSYDHQCQLQTPPAQTSTSTTT